MTPQQIIKMCDQQIAISGKKADIMFLLPGKWGKTNKRRFCNIKDAPIGEIVCDNFGKGLHVMFNATEIKKFTLKMLE